jgi:magnesium-transporting ATPase (P-type)
MRRLMFWHGRTFAWKITKFVMWFLWKAMLFSTPLLLMNVYAGFSGTNYLDDMYFALYEVLMTSFSLWSYIILETDVHYEYELKISLPKLYGY